MKILSWVSVGLGWLAICVLSILLSSCSGLPTVVPTVTTLPDNSATAEPTLTTVPDNTPESVVTVTGNVYVRTVSGMEIGWLASGTVVNATCRGDWCYITGGQFDGGKFWRGCTDNNPDNTGCMVKP